MPRGALYVGSCLLLLCALSLPIAAQRKPDSGFVSEGRERSFAKFVEIPGAERLGSDQCRACHEELGKSFRRSFHAQQSVECEDRWQHAATRTNASR
jgi:hypothetical protein